MDNDRVTSEAFHLLAASTDQFEGYAHAHASRIAKLADEVAKLFNLARSDRNSLQVAALTHDLGEVAMKREYFERPGALNDEERQDMMRHTVIGEQEAAQSGADRGAQLLVRWHHESWNGGGYPDALRREHIPLGARILHVVDAYASLTDSRPFRPARTVEDARSHLTELAGLEFDPRVVRAFLSLTALPELESFSETMKPDDKHWGTDDMIRQLAAELEI